MNYEKYKYDLEKKNLNNNVKYKFKIPGIEFVVNKYWRCSFKCMNLMYIFKIEIPRFLIKIKIKTI